MIVTSQRNLSAMLMLAAVHTVTEADVSANLMHPDWHPDGQLLIAQGGCTGSIDLYLIDLQQRTVRFLWDDGANEGYPRWFSDGRKITFHRMDRPAGRADIFTASVSDAGTLSDVTRVIHGSFTIEPAPAPDGTRLAYTLPGANGLDVAWSYISDAGRPRVLRTADAENFPSWTPDGRGILFHARRSDGTQIFTRDLVDGQIIQLTHARGPNMVGHLRHDGRALAYSSERDGDREIYVLNLESGEDRRITQRPGRDGYPKFSPDGRHIAYHSAHPDRPTTTRVLNLDSGEFREFSCTDAYDLPGP